MFARVATLDRETSPPRRPVGATLRTMAAAGLALLAAGLSAGGAQARNAKPTYPDMLPREARSQPLCEAEAGRVFVQHRRGTACIAFFATSGHADRRHAVLFFDGDLPFDRFSDAAHHATQMTHVQAGLQVLADKARIRIVRVARLGLDGSSGNHGQRHRPDEVLAMNAAVDALKVRLGLDTVSLAGQSRGAMIVASLLTFGRGDVACAALGSGVYEHAQFIYRATLNAGGKVPLREIQRIVYDPADHVGAILPDTRRRIFVLGDPADQRTPFDQQARFGTAIAAAGHHAKVMPVLAGDALHHGATAYALNVAARCALGQSDAQIGQGVERITRAVGKGLVAKGTPQNASATPVVETGSLPSQTLGASSRP